MTYLSLRDMWDLSGPGHEPVSPASAGGLSITAPPGKAGNQFFYSSQKIKETLKENTEDWEFW